MDAIKDLSFALSGPLKKRTGKEIIAAKLADMIASGLVLVGDLLPSERELAKVLSVSRETIRGAIQVLSAHGLVEVTQGSRTRVVRSDGIDLGGANLLHLDFAGHTAQAIYGARRAIERSVLLDAAREISDKSLLRLEHLLSVQKELFDDPVAFQISDKEFHTIIYRSCPNSVLSELASGLYSYALDLRRKVMLKKGAVERSYNDHVVLFAALARRDAEAAAAAMSDHIANVYATTLEATAQFKSGDR